MASRSTRANGRPTRGRGPKNVGATIARIFSYLKPHRTRLVFILIGILIAAAAQMGPSYIIKPVINNYVEPLIGVANPDLSGFVRMLLVLAAAYAVGVAAAYAYSRAMITVSTETLARMRTDLFNHMQTLPVSFFDKHTHGELMSRFTNDIDALREMLSQAIPQFITSAFTLPASFIIMLVMSPQLTLLVVVMLFVMLWVLRIIGGRSRAAYKAQQTALGRVNGYIEEMIDGSRVIKVFCREKLTMGGFSSINEELRRAATGASTFGTIMMPIMHNLSYIHYAITATVGCFMCINGTLDVGTLASYLLFTRTFSQPITQLSQQTNSIFSALAGAERIFDLLDRGSEVDEGTVTLVNASINPNGKISESPTYTGAWAWREEEDDVIKYTPLRGDVRFFNVDFGYSPEKQVLHDLSLYAKPGQKIAFVGSTGAGKTTITNLINRFYEIDSGVITYDGIPIRKIKKDSLRRSLGMVLQDTHLFTATVRENIRYGRLDATDGEVEAAARLAGAHSFIKHLPHGYDTVITGDGSNLSQGQRQLLNIARAACANAPVLILDEATSSIDTRTEAIIEQGMDKLMAGRTVFVIAHRLSTVRNSDAIMVLENGVIIERGNHADLIKQQGKYYQLYTGAFELS